MAVIIGTGFGLAPPFWAGREGSRHHARIFCSIYKYKQVYTNQHLQVRASNQRGGTEFLFSEKRADLRHGGLANLQTRFLGGICLVVQRSQRDPKKGGVCMLSQGKYRFLHAKQKKKNSLLYRLRSTARNPWALLQLLGLADMGPAKPPPLFLHAPLIERFQKASRTLPV